MWRYLMSIIVIMLVTFPVIIYILKKINLYSVPVVVCMVGSSFAVSCIFPALFINLGITWAIIIVVAIAFVLASGIYMVSVLFDGEYGKEYDFKTIPHVIHFNLNELNENVKSKLGGLFGFLKNFRTGKRSEEDIVYIEETEEQAAGDEGTVSVEAVNEESVAEEKGKEYKENEEKVKGDISDTEIPAGEAYIHDINKDEAESCGCDNRAAENKTDDEALKNETGYEAMRNETNIRSAEKSEADDVCAGEAFVSAEVSEAVAGNHVDSFENIDKMGVDYYIRTADELKLSGDMEGAILNYMYALECNPERDLVFWIVLDICTLYKQMGQKLAAKDVLHNFSEAYQDVIDSQMVKEIEDNL